jgi:hypothetical protein
MTKVTPALPDKEDSGSEFGKSKNTPKSISKASISGKSKNKDNNPCSCV